MFGPFGQYGIYHKSTIMNKNIWHSFYNKLIDSYLHISTIKTGEGIATVIQVPENEDTSIIVNNLRLTVMGVGLCARITTFIKGTPLEDALQMLEKGQPIPENDGDHIVIMENADFGNLIKISNELGSEFTSEEVVGIESVLTHFNPWSLDFIGKRMISVGFEKHPVSGPGFNQLFQSYRTLINEHFPDSKINEEDFSRMIKSQTLWFGNMGYPIEFTRQPIA